MVVCWKGLALPFPQNYSVWGSGTLWSIAEYVSTRPTTRLPVAAIPLPPIRPPPPLLRYSLQALGPLPSRLALLIFLLSVECLPGTPCSVPAIRRCVDR